MQLQSGAACHQTLLGAGQGDGARRRVACPHRHVELGATTLRAWCCVGSCKVVLALGEVPGAASRAGGMCPALGLLLCFGVAW